MRSLVNVFLLVVYNGSSFCSDTKNKIAFDISNDIAEIMDRLWGLTINDTTIRLFFFSINSEANPRSFQVTERHLLIVSGEMQMRPLA